MATCLEGPSTTATNPPLMHMLQRHRDILYDFAKEFKRTKATIAATKDHADLLGSIRDDINAYKAGNSQEFLLNERIKIDSSHKMADIVLDQAYETREALNNQGRTLFNSRSRVTTALSRFPLINGLIGKINTKKRKDAVVMGLVIGNLKKSWHPATLRNIEKVYLRERAADEEKKKTAQLQKELEEQRAHQELKRMNESSGRVKLVQQAFKYGPKLLSFLSALNRPGSAAQVAEEREAYLLGKKKVDKLIEQGKSVDEMSANNTFSPSDMAIYGMTANSTRDIQNKIREDPLLAIKRREQKSLEAILNNPLHVKAIAAAKKEKKKEKKEKKKRDKHEKGHHRSDDSDGGKKRNGSSLRDEDRLPEFRNPDGPPERRTWEPRDDDEPSRKRRRTRSPSLSADRRRDRSEGVDRRRDRSTDRRDGSRDRRCDRATVRSPDRAERRRRDRSHDRVDRRQERSRDRAAARRTSDRSTDRRPGRDASPVATVPVAASAASKSGARTKLDEDRQRRLEAMQTTAVDMDRGRRERVAESRKKEKEEDAKDLEIRMKRLQDEGGLGEGFRRDLHNKTFEKVIVMFKENTPAAKIEEAVKQVESNGGVVGHRYTSTILGFAATIPDNVFTSFQSNELIESIEADGEVSTLAKSKEYGCQVLQEVSPSDQLAGGGIFGCTKDDLISCHGTWLIVEQHALKGNEVRARPDKQVHGEKAHWHVDKHHASGSIPEHITIKNSSTHMYLACGADGVVYLTSSASDDDTYWLLEREDQRVAIKNVAHKRYLASKDPNMIEKLIFHEDSHVHTLPDRVATCLWEEDVV
ncbi:Golgi SNAP receptor complex member 1 [Irineochytrium annulatum]|nr:Golgi SNAP receptor complex member 1 [Irineochytrium annulatum]